MTKRRLPLLLPLVMAVTTATAMAKHPIVGNYTRGTVDSLEQIVAFSDKKFCMAVMAGNLDLVTVGHWYDAEQGYVEFKEDKSEQRGQVYSTPFTLQDILLFVGGFITLMKAFDHRPDTIRCENDSQ